MKLKTKRSRKFMALLAVPILASATWVSLPDESVAQGNTATKAAKAPRPKSRTEDVSVVQLNANTLVVAAKEGNLNVNLVPTTQILRIEQKLPAGELRVGDKLQFSLRGVSGMPTVQSVAPLTLRFDDNTTIVFGNTDKKSFDRATQIPQTEIAAGQKVKAGMNVFADGRIEARTVHVLVAPPAAVK